MKRLLILFLIFIIENSNFDDKYIQDLHKIIDLAKQSKDLSIKIKDIELIMKSYKK